MYLYLLSKSLARRFLLNSVTKYEEGNAKALNQIFYDLKSGHSGKNHMSWLNMVYMAGFPELWSSMWPKKLEKMSMGC